MNSAYTEKFKIADLKPYERNPRKISDKAVDAVAKSIRMNGALDPIEIDETGEVLSGHTRLKAYKALGYTEVPVVQHMGLTQTQKRTYRIAANKTAEYSEWDDELLAAELKDIDMEIEKLQESTGVSEKEVRELLDEEPADAEPEISKADELQKKWGIQRGDIWHIGAHRLMCGDSTSADDVARLMDGKKADMVFTSPPYGVGVNYGETYKDTIDNLRTMLPKLSKLWKNIIIDGGFCVVNFGDIVSASDILKTDEPCEYPMALEYWPVFRSDGWLLWSRRIWCKPGAGTGSMQCISSNRAATNWEHIWTWKKHGKSKFNKQTTGEYPSQNGWIDSTHSEGLAIGLKDHGAGMPPLPALYSISTHSMHNDIIHEPFTGTGTTIVAAQNTGRICYGMEISPAYCSVILERIKTAFPDINIEKIQ